MNIPNIMLLIPLIAGIAITTMIVFAYQSTQAQEVTQDRIFVKSFCNAEDSLLADMRYTNGEELSYTSSGCPESVKVVHKWNELRLSDQTIITSRMSTNGYLDKTAIITQQSK